MARCEERPEHGAPRKVKTCFGEKDGEKGRTEEIHTTGCATGETPIWEETAKKAKASFQEIDQDSG